MPNQRRLALVAAFVLSAVAACSSGDGGSATSPGGSGGSGGTGGSGAVGGSGGAPVADVAAPVVTIASPMELDFVDGATVEIRGTASDDVGIVRLAVAANYAVPEPVEVTPGESITFAIPVEPRAGENVALVRATDAAGNESSATVVFFAAPPTGPAKVVSFEINPAAVEAGDEVTLSWKVAGTPPVTLWLEPVGDVSGKTSVTIEPTRNIPVALEARNAEGTDRARGEVVVSGGPHQLRPGGGVIAPGARQRFWVENVENPLGLSWSNGTTGGNPLLWTAPTEPGLYEVWAETATHRATVQVEVREMRPSLRRWELAGGQSLADMDNGASLLVSADGALWLSGGMAIKSVLHMPAGTNAWQILGSPLTTAPRFLARDPDGALYAASAETAAWAWDGAAWTALPDLAGRIHGIRWEGGLYAIAGAPSETRLYRLDEGAWLAVGPQLPAGFTPKGFLRRASGSWIAWSDSIGAAAFLLEWTPGAEAWSTVSTDRAVSSVIEAADQSLYLGGFSGVRRLVGTTQTEVGGAIPANRKIDSLDASGATILACVEGIPWRAVDGGEFAAIAHPGGAFGPAGCTARFDGAGRVFLSGLNGTWRWADDTGWEALGGRGLPKGLTLVDLAFGPDGRMALAGRSNGNIGLREAPFYVLAGDTWQPVTVAVEEGDTQPYGAGIVWDGSGWIAVTPHAAYRIDAEGLSAEALPPLPTPDPPSFFAVLSRDGAAYVFTSLGAYRLADGAAAWELLGGPREIDAVTFDAAGTLWIAGAKLMTVLPAGSDMWLTRGAIDYPFPQGSFSQVVAGEGGEMWSMIPDGPLRLPVGAGMWQLAGMGYPGARFSVQSLAIGARTWVVSADGLFELGEEGAWVPVVMPDLPALAPRFAKAAPDGTLYVATNQLGLVRYLPEEAP